jgi:probable phosphoglycerate mutase
VTYLKELRELNNGEAAGLTTEQAEAIRTEISYPIGDWIPYGGSESWNMMITRIENCMEKIAML